MGAVVFDNHVFDAWLTNKSEEILSKVDREPISTEEMLTLILKAQTNHFHHVDVEFRQEFKAIRGEIHELRDEMHELEMRLQNEMKDITTNLRADIQESNTSLRSEMNELKKDFSKNFQNIQWRFAGILIPLFGSLYLKLFLG